MSVYQVDLGLIDALMTAARFHAPGRGLRIHHGDEVIVAARPTVSWLTDWGQVLVDANAASVAHRYQEEPQSIKYDYLQPREGGFHVRPKAVEALALLTIYESQSCCHPRWLDTGAKAFCDALRAKSIRELAGYDQLAASQRFRRKS